MKKVLCAGEALFDFISLDKVKVGFSKSFEKRVGGSPLNVAIGIARLGFKVSYLTKLSNDSFGEAIFEFLSSEGIDMDLVKFDPKAKTTLAFVSVDERGIPEYEFYRDGMADTLLQMQDIDKIQPHGYDLLHFGSIAMSSYPVANTLWELFKRFKGRTLISFDPNIRPQLVEDMKSYIDILEEILRGADIVKMSVEDMKWLGWESLEDFVRRFKREQKVTILTKGKMGSEAIFNGEKIFQRAYNAGRVVDTTGCGDAFMAAFVVEFLRNGWNMESLKRSLDFASAAAALVSTRKGAAPSMPTLTEVKSFLEKRIKLGEGML